MYAAVTRDEAQRSIWPFYEFVIYGIFQTCGNSRSIRMMTAPGSLKQRSSPVCICGERPRKKPSKKSRRHSRSTIPADVKIDVPAFS